MASYSENYGYTFQNAETYAEIPVNSFYTLNYSAGANGTVTADKENGAQMEANSLVTLTATADSGYDFSGWTVNGEAVQGSGNTLTWTVENGYLTNPNVTAYHRKLYRASFEQRRRLVLRLEHHGFHFQVG